VKKAGCGVSPANVSLVYSISGSKYQFRLHPHAADAAVGEIAVQKLTGRRVKDAPGRHVHVLRMIEGVQRFPAKLQTPVLAAIHDPYLPAPAPIPQVMASATAKPNQYAS
jgi:hypothetical protein